MSCPQYYLPYLQFIANTGTATVTAFDAAFALGSNARREIVPKYAVYVNNRLELGLTDEGREAVFDTPSPEPEPEATLRGGEDE